MTRALTRATERPLGRASSPDRPDRHVAAAAVWVSTALAALGGALLETAFPGLSWWWAAPVAIAILLLVLRRDSIPAGLLTGATFGLTFFLLHVWWADSAVGQPIGWIALAASQAAFISAFGGIWVWVRRARWLHHRPGRQILAATVIWVTIERLRGRWPFGGFPWGGLAFSQTDGPLLRLAPVGGTALVSAVVVMSGALMTTLVGTGSARRQAAVGLAVLLGVMSGAQLVRLPVAPEVGTLRIGAVQGNVPSAQIDFRARALQVTANHAAGTGALLDSAGPGTLDLVLWPESAADVDPRSDAVVAAAVDGAARAAGAPILLGTQRFGGQRRFNDYILWEPGAGSLASYTKQHPVPFGEYIPYRSFFRHLTRTVDRVGTDMAAGSGTALVKAPIARLSRSVPLTTVICFEVAYDELVRSSVLAGSEAIIVPTNNASFGRTEESAQQLAMSRFRAAEHGRAVVQVSTVGISAVIAPDGAVRQRTGLFTGEQLIDELPLRTSLTVADRLGSWPGLLVDLAGAVLLGSAVLGRARRRGSR